MSVLLSRPAPSFLASIDPEDLVLSSPSSTPPAGRGRIKPRAAQQSSEMYSSQADAAAGIRNVEYQAVDEGHEDDSSSGQAAPKSMYGSLVGYCFTVNYILGVGVLGMPYAFYKGGWALSTLCLGFVTIMATFTALWLVDVSLRAQYVRRADTLLRGSGGSDEDMAISGSSGNDSLNHPPVSSHSQHRFEMNELVEMFVGVRARRFYEILVVIYLVGALWSYTSVFASSLASHVGLPGINNGNECDIYKNHSNGCSDLYLTYIALFSLVAIPLTCLDLTEMKILQIGLAIFRFVSLATMMITSIVAIYSYPNPDPLADSPDHAPYLSRNFVAFDWTNLGLVFPIAIYSQIFHHSVPGLSHPLRNKAAAPKVFSAVLATTMILYSALGISVGFFYGASIPQTCTIAWAEYSGGHINGKPGWASFIGYMIVLFPPLDIISAFPLNAITLGNNLLCAFVEDERKQQLKRFKLPFRFLAAIPPIVGAMVVRDLGVILKYTGCVGVLIAFAYPCVLQYKSVQRCKQMGIVNINTASSSNAAPSGFSVDNSEAVPTYNIPLINKPQLVAVVFAFSMIGLVSVIVLSAAGISS